MCYTLKLHSMLPEDGNEIGYLMRHIVFDRLSFKFGVRKMPKKGGDSLLAKEETGFGGLPGNGTVDKGNINPIHTRNRF